MIFCVKKDVKNVKCKKKISIDCKYIDATTMLLHCLFVRGGGEHSLNQGEKWNI